MAIRIPRMGILLRRTLTSTTSENYYKLLGVRESFMIDSENLASRFKHLQRQWHPDKFGLKPGTDREGAANMSAKLNEAYSVLRVPYKRAKHLLQIRGNEQPELRVCESVQLDPRFLMWVVEMRENIAHADGDRTKLEAIKQTVDEELGNCLTRLATAFEHDHLQDAAVETAKLQYLRRMEQAIDDLLH